MTPEEIEARKARVRELQRVPEGETQEQMLHRATALHSEVYALAEADVDMNLER